MHKILFFQENLKKVLGSTSKFRWGELALNAGIFFLFGLSAHALLNLLNKLTKRDKIVRLVKHFISFAAFNKFNNTRA